MMLLLCKCIVACLCACPGTSGARRAEFRYARKSTSFLSSEESPLDFRLIASPSSVRWPDADAPCGCGRAGWPGGAEGGERQSSSPASSSSSSSSCFLPAHTNALSAPHAQAYTYIHTVLLLQNGKHHKGEAPLLSSCSCRALVGVSCVKST